MSESDDYDDSVDNEAFPLDGVDYNNDHHTCDWASEQRCSPSIQLKKCQYPEGCDNYVHHLCTLEWAHDNGIGELSILVLCRKHHPEYQNYLSKLHLVGQNHTVAKSGNQGRNRQKFLNSMRRRRRISISRTV
jgi:hypothetical protein